MPRGGARPGAGRPKGSKDSKPRKRKPAATAPVATTGEPMEPLEYMLAVMNDPKADPRRRDSMAIAAAPFCHVRGDREGKKDKKKAKAEAAGTGRFAPSAPPSLTLLKKGEQ